MTLIDCPECSREVSSHAATCPECAYPLAATRQPAITSGAHDHAKRGWWKLAVSLAGRVLAGMILVGFAVDESSVTGLIGGLLVGGSAIPAWYRDKIERLKASRTAVSVDERIRERMAELEDRYREQIARLEQLHTGRVTELEERVEFAERLLTKQREQIGPG